MAEATNYTFKFQELAAILVRQQGIKEGFWGIYIEFGLGAANINTAPGERVLAPAAINIVQKIGIQKFDEANNLTVDASEVNSGTPAKSTKRSPKKNAK
jgi:hypothetical protein